MVRKRNSKPDLFECGSDDTEPYVELPEDAEDLIQRVAKRTCDSTTLSVAARHGDPRIRLTVARNPALTQRDALTRATLTYLIGDDFWQVRAYVAQWQDLSGDEQHVLRLDSDQQVRLALAANRVCRLSQSTMTSLLTEDLEVRESLARNPNLSEDIMLRLASDEEFEVRDAIWNNRKITLAVHELLSPEFADVDA